MRTFGPQVPAVPPLSEAGHLELTNGEYILLSSQDLDVCPSLAALSLSFLLSGVSWPQWLHDSASNDHSGQKGYHRPTRSISLVSSVRKYILVATILIVRHPRLVLGPMFWYDNQETIENASLMTKI